MGPGAGQGGVPGMFERLKGAPHVWVLLSNRQNVLDKVEKEPINSQVM